MPHASCCFLNDKMMLYENDNLGIEVAAPQVHRASSHSFKCQKNIYSKGGSSNLAQKNANWCSRGVKKLESPGLEF